MPDLREIASPAVAAALEAWVEQSARFNDRWRDRDVAIRVAENAAEEVVRQAAEQGIKRGDLPKDLRRGVKAAKEEAEESQLRLDAQGEVLYHSYTQLVAVVAANEEKLVEAALTKASRSLQRMAAAREAFAAAASDAAVSYGMLGLFAHARTDGVKPVLRELPQSRRQIATDEALSTMARAVGNANLDLDAFRRGEVPTRAEIEALSDV